MKKISLILLGCVFIGWLVYALIPSLFPDSSTFPRIPVWDMTIWWALSRLIGTIDLANYGGDGTVENTRMLDEMTATGYIKNSSPCGNAWEKWLWIDNNGFPLCGNTAPMLADYGLIDSQDCAAIVYHSDNTFGNTSTGQTLKAGDIVKTAPGCTMTIAFSDLSIIRLDGDTVVSFDVGYLPDGTTIASALLDNGSLWWRILTETWSYSVGTREIIAWVRWTSISLVSTGNTIGTIAWSGTGWNIPKTASPYNTEVTVIDTTTSTGAVIACKKSNGWFQKISSLAKRKLYNIPPGWCGWTTPIIISKNKDLLLSESLWIKKNTRKDLRYMYQKLALSGTVLPMPKTMIITNELNVTKPEESLPGILTASGILESGNICDITGDHWWGNHYGCQANDVIAIADYTMMDLQFPTDFPLMVRDVAWSIQVVHNTLTPTIINISPNRWIEIGATWQFIDYSRLSIEWYLGESLSGKYLEVILDDLPPNNASTKFIIHEDSSYVKTTFNGTYTCNGTVINVPNPLPTPLCPRFIHNNNKKITYMMQNWSKLRIGNDFTLPWNWSNPIQQKIRSIKIKRNP